MTYFEKKREMCMILGSKNRTCNDLDCMECPLCQEANGTEYPCMVFEMMYPNWAEQIIDGVIERYCAAHNIKTRKEFLLENFPDTILYNDGVPRFCPSDIGLGDTCSGASRSCTECWDEHMYIDEIEDEADDEIEEIVIHLDSEREIDYNEVKNLKLMHEVMRHMNDENAYCKWICYMPDEPMEEDFIGIVEDDEFQEMFSIFRKILSKYADGGLYNAPEEVYRFAVKIKPGIENLHR